jgi:hypothetical protein
MLLTYINSIVLKYFGRRKLGLGFLFIHNLLTSYSISQIDLRQHSSASVLAFSLFS